MNNRKEIVWHNFVLRPTIYGVLLAGVGGKLAIEDVGKYQSWNQLQREQVVVPATVLRDQVLLSDSGKAMGHDLSYEFVALGTGSGSQRSTADVQAQLQEQFWNGSSEFSVNENALSPALPEGQQFVRGEQLVKMNDYKSLDVSRPIDVIYAVSDPENSAIANTDAGPSLGPTLIVLALIAGGAWFLWQGVKRCFYPPAACDTRL